MCENGKQHRQSTERLNAFEFASGLHPVNH
jgi:hypothetical protein